MQPQDKLILAISEMTVRKEDNPQKILPILEECFKSGVRNFDLVTPWCSNLVIQCAYSDLIETLKALRQFVLTYDCHLTLTQPSLGENRTSLHIACLFGSQSVFKFLIEQTDCELDLADCCGRTPLMLASACLRGKEIGQQMVKKLLEKGVIADKRDCYGQTYEFYCQRPYINYPDRNFNCLGQTHLLMAHADIFTTSVDERKKKIKELIEKLPTFSIGARSLIENPSLSATFIEALLLI